jgi:DNA-binding response OmpR family regulator
MRDKVLVVEDEPTLLDTLEYNLTHQGYETYTAADGPTALDVARQERPDLVVLDVMLPGLDGFEVCRILRQEIFAHLEQAASEPEEESKKGLLFLD